MNTLQFRPNLWNIQMFFLNAFSLLSLYSSKFYYINRCFLMHLSELILTLYFFVIKGKHIFHSCLNFCSPGLWYADAFLTHSPSPPSLRSATTHLIEFMRPMKSSSSSVIIKHGGVSSRSCYWWILIWGGHSGGLVHICSWQTQQVMPFSWP